MSRASVITEASNFSTGQGDTTQMGTLYDDIVNALGDLPLFVQKQSASVSALAQTFNFVVGLAAIPITVLAYIFNDFQCSLMRLRDLEAVNQNWRNRKGQVTTVVREEEPSQTVAFYRTPNAPTSTFTVLATVYPSGGTLPAIYEPMMVHSVLAREYARPSNHQDGTLAAAEQAMAGFFMQAASSQMTPPQR